MENVAKKPAKPNLRPHRPLCGWCFIFQVSSSGLLFLHVSGSGFPNFVLSISAEKRIFYSW